MDFKAGESCRILYPDARLLAVDDEPGNCVLLEAILEEAGYTNVRSTTDSREVEDLCRDWEPDLILLDLMMPYLDGFQVMQCLQNLPCAVPFLPILVLTADVSAETRRYALSHGAHDFLTKPFDHAEVVLRVGNLLTLHFLHHQLYKQNLTLEERVRHRTREVEESQLEILERLAQASEFRDDDTGQHTQRVGEMAYKIAEAMGLSHDQVESIRRAAPLHDVGKIGIPDQVLLKPGKLTTAEFAIIKTHTTIGSKLLSGSRSEMVQMAERIALTHHERWDGNGYPNGWAGTEIPIEGRITAVVDVFDALTNERPYKKAWPFDEAVTEIVTHRGHQFDPKVVDAFLQVIHAYDVAQLPAKTLSAKTSPLKTA